MDRHASGSTQRELHRDTDIPDLSVLQTPPGPRGLEHDHHALRLDAQRFSQCGLELKRLVFHLLRIIQYVRVERASRQSKGRGWDGRCDCVAKAGHRVVYWCTARHGADARGRLVVRDQPHRAARALNVAETHLCFPQDVAVEVGGLAAPPGARDDHIGVRADQTLHTTVGVHPWAAVDAVRPVDGAGCQSIRQLAGLGGLHGRVSGSCAGQARLLPELAADVSVVTQLAVSLRRPQRGVGEPAQRNVRAVVFDLVPAPAGTAVTDVELRAAEATVGLGDLDGRVETELGPDSASLR